MNTVEEYKQAKRDYQILKDFEELIADDNRLSHMLAYKSAKTVVDNFKIQTEDGDSYKSYIKEPIDKNEAVSKKEEEDLNKQVEEAAKRVTDKLNKVLGDFNISDLFDGLDIEVYLH